MVARRTGMRGLLTVALVSVLASWVQAQERFHVELDPPGDREFVKDSANMLEPADDAAIRTLCDKLLTEHATPILAVTIESMQAHGGDNLRIETFARLLFDQWKIGHAELNGAEWNTGILLLVSKGDRKARIELGAGWQGKKNAETKTIMDTLIVPRFKEGEFSAGIRAGVEALDQVARGKPLPQAPRSKRSVIWTVVLAGIGIFTLVSMFRSGNKGLAWLAWGIVFGLIGTVIYTVLTHQSGSSGGGFSGGSFGGGGGGGGGATGSW